MLDYKDKVNFKNYDVTTVNKQLQYTYQLMSQEVAKCNQGMKFGQLIEYILINFFMKNHMQNLVEKLFPVLFIKSQNWTYIWICQIEDYRITLKLSSRPLPFTSYKAILKHRKKSGTSLPASFPACFLKKNISLVIFYYLTKFH